MVDDIIEVFRQRFGENWGRDEDANLRFSVDAERVLQEMDGVHLIGDPDVQDGEITLTVWVDEPINDLMRADRLAYDVFGRISDDLFYAERHFDSKSIRYPFVTGSNRHGHVGSLVLAGPHAADFADRHLLRSTGGVRFQA
ncbi:MAG: hypothetical protein QOF33_736 [Thermomicrobiales bacterium]|jgi:hypothetical protein|nr:hypothetical protein [Thermomicrobiales bacterium]MEA2530940.1 hypothetical protein [Thermomicrobiales bacterium]MEA2582651.1 hypothetical protein [Thermomicrobiales bacterium]MEA2595353.1 hypothetical protein [Thermomicrobiales bacterium]